ncbi:hypothetical protein ACX1DW_01430 [Stutzerimonas sp. KH-1]
MTKHDLKELAAMGAELGAAKAEVERLKSLMRQAIPCLAMSTNSHATSYVRQFESALSPQPEPTDTYTAVDMATAAAQGFRDGQAAVEQAPAQDEREAFEAHLKKDGIAEEFLEREEGFTERYSWVAIQDAWEIWQAAIATRPAQTEQQPEQSA